MVKNFFHYFMMLFFLSGLLMGIFITSFFFTAGFEEDKKNLITKTGYISKVTTGDCVEYTDVCKTLIDFEDESEFGFSVNFIEEKALKDIIAQESANFTVEYLQKHVDTFAFNGYVKAYSLKVGDTVIRSSEETFNEDKKYIRFVPFMGLAIIILFAYLLKGMIKSKGAVPNNRVLSNKNKF